MLLAESLLGTSSVAATYIEDVFSTYLYTGTGANLTITNGIDLSTKGGLVWIKQRSGGQDHTIFDTNRGVNNYLRSNSTGAQNPGGTYTDLLTAFNTTGFSLGADASTAGFVNASGSTYVSWTFRKQAKFFDVVTYTGNGAGSRSIAHSLGTKPAWIMVKRTDSTSNWFHFAWNGIDGVGGFTARSLSLNSTNAAGITTSNGTNPHTATTFDTGEISDITGTNPNVNNATYVAYLFATNAGGFGAAGTDNVISCGSFTTSSGVSGLVNIGFEPQWVLIKRTDSATLGDWQIYDNMRGVVASNNGGTYAQSSQKILPNSSAAEATDGFGLGIYQQGFNFNNSSGVATYIYIAIRRGPMKTPTSGTSVFGLSARTGTGVDATVTGGQTDDAILVKNRGRVQASLFSSRLTGTGYLSTSSTAAEAAAGTTILQASPWDVMDGVKLGTTSYFTNATADTFINYLFRRAPGFFDVVCYTGDGVVGRTISHNLGVAPEFMIIKARNNSANWAVYSGSPTSYMFLNSNAGSTTSSGYWNNTAPSASVFTVGGVSAVNVSAAYTYVAYLFATVAGVSKVGSYTGTGTTKQIDCGFTGGARFVLIKRTDSTGDWYVWDSARGIVAGNDPYLLLNSTAAEVTSTDYIDTYSAGFEISSTAPAAINANGGSFIFLAIA